MQIIKTFGRLDESCAKDSEANSDAARTTLQTRNLFIWLGWGRVGCGRGEAERVPVHHSAIDLGYDGLGTTDFKVRRKSLAPTDSEVRRTVPYRYSWTVLPVRALS